MNAKAFRNDRPEAGLGQEGRQRRCRKKERERSRGKLGKKKAEEMSEPYGLPRVNRYYILKDNGRAPSKASVRAGKRQKEVKKLA